MSKNARAVGVARCSVCTVAGAKASIAAFRAPVPLFLNRRIIALFWTSFVLCVWIASVVVFVFCSGVFSLFSSSVFSLFLLNLFIIFTFPVPPPFVCGYSRVADHSLS